MVIITTKKELAGPPGILVKKSSTILSPPNPLKTKEKTEAPIRIKNTIEVILTLLSATSLIVFRPIFVVKNAINVEPTAPNAADSVGVATPARIDPSTT